MKKQTIIITTIQEVPDEHLNVLLEGLLMNINQQDAIKTVQNIIELVKCGSCEIETNLSSNLGITIPTKYYISLLSKVKAQ